MEETDTAAGPQHEHDYAFLATQRRLKKKKTATKKSKKTASKPPTSEKPKSAPASTAAKTKKQTKPPSTPKPSKPPTSTEKPDDETKKDKKKKKKVKKKKGTNETIDNEAEKKKATDKAERTDEDAQTDEEGSGNVATPVTERDTADDEQKKDDTTADEKDDKTDEKDDKTDEIEDSETGENGQEEDSQQEETDQTTGKQPQEEEAGPCVAAKNCEDCAEEAKNVEVDNSTCVWIRGVCKLVEADATELVDMCANISSVQGSAMDDKDDEEGFGVKNVLLLTFLFGVLFWIRGQAMQNQGLVLAGDSRRRGPRNPRRHYETAPLTAADDDWGWDDEGAAGDVELATRGKKEEEDLQMALAMSLSSHRSNNAPKRRGSPRVSPSNSLRGNSMSSVNAGSSAQGRSKKTITRPPVRPKQDDFFTSMGLGPSSSTSGGGTGALAAAAEQAAADTDANWDDDADLDDLLNDD